MSEPCSQSKTVTVDPQPGMTLMGHMPQPGSTPAQQVDLAMNEGVNFSSTVQVVNGLEGQSFKRETIKFKRETARNQQGWFGERNESIATSGLGERQSDAIIHNACPGFLVEILGPTKSHQERNAAGDSHNQETNASLRVLDRLPIFPDTTAVFTRQFTHSALQVPHVQCGRQNRPLN